MTENLKNGVPVHLFNPSGFVAQKSGPETNLWTTPAGGDEKQVFAVTLRRRHRDVKNGVTACSASKADPGCSSFVPLCVPEGQFVSSGRDAAALGQPQPAPDRPSPPQLRLPGQPEAGGP